MKRKTVYWVEPVEYQKVGVYDGKSWYGTYGWSTAHLDSFKKVKKMVRDYPEIHFRVEKIVFQKGNRWHYPIYTLKYRKGKIVKLPEMWYIEV